MSYQTLRELRDSLSSLNESDRQLLDSYLLEETPIWTPLPGPQLAAYYSEADVLFYGGAAGGGKTDLAVGLALTQHQRSIIFRREGTQLLAVVDRLRQVLGGDTGYNSQKGVWRVSNRCQVELAGVPNPGDEERFQGRPHDLKVFDEAPQFLESQVKFLMGWTRTTDPNQRTRILLTGNPPVQAQGYWITRMFGPWLDPDHPRYPTAPGVLLWYAMLDGEEQVVEDGLPFIRKGELVLPQSRTFIPSDVRDNPFLLETGYVSQLQSLPEPLRSQLLYGDFAAGAQDDEWQVIPTSWVKAAQARWRSRESTGTGEMTSMGVDVARGGKDETVIYARHGWWYAEPVVLKGEQTDNGPKVAGQVLAHSRDGCPIHVDVIGVGTSVVDFLDSVGVNVVPLNGATLSHTSDKTGRLRFVNKRAELWWKLREKLDPAQTERDPIALPPSKTLLVDLCTPRWRLTPRGIQVESKEDIYKRLGRSPDHGDACVYAAEESPARYGKGKHIGWGDEIPYQDDSEYL